jgi:hypothetical protein
MYTHAQGKVPSRGRPLHLVARTHPAPRSRQPVTADQSVQADSGLASSTAPPLKYDFGKVSILSPAEQAKRDCGRSAQSECAAGKHEPRATEQPNPADTANLRWVLSDNVLRSSGTPLDASVLQHFELRFGVDFSSVRIHTNERAAASARLQNALAYTAGRNLVFAEGQYAPGTSDGRRLLAHELTHVVQQRNFGKIKSASNGKTADHLEREAEEVSQAIATLDFAPAGARLAPMNQISPGAMSAGAIQRRPDPASDEKLNEARLANLAKDPRKAHEAWRQLKTADKFIVLDRMARRYGAAFADQFRELAEKRRGKPKFGVTYWQPHTGPTPEQLKAKGWRFMDMENTGNAAFDVELWVRPSGDITRRDVSTYVFGQTPDSTPGTTPKKIPPVTPPPPPPPPPRCPDSEFADQLKDITQKIWPAIAAFENNVERLEANPQGADRAEIETAITTTRTTARNLITELSKLTQDAKDADDDCIDDAAGDEWMNAMEQYSAISQRYNGINRQPASGSGSQRTSGGSNAEPPAGGSDAEPNP